MLYSRLHIVTLGYTGLLLGATQDYMGIWTTQRGYTVLHEITQGYSRLCRAKLVFLQ